MNIIKTSIILALLLLISGQTTLAQSVEQLNVEAANDFVIGPGKTEIIVEPGDSATRELRVTSRIPGTTTFSLSVEDFTGSDDPDQTVELLGEETGPYSLKDFVDLPLTEFTLNFGERVTIPIEVNIPVGVEPGGRYGAIIVSNAPTQIAEANTGAVVVSRLGSLFLVRVAGEVNESGVLEDFSLSNAKSVYFNSYPEQFEISYNNDGSVHLIPHGVIEVKNLFGSVVDQIPVDAYFALPKSVRSRVVTWDEPTYKFGYYRAELTLNRGYDDLQDVKKIGMWILPWQPMVIGIMTILLLAILITIISKKFEIKRK